MLFTIGQIASVDWPRAAAAGGAKTWRPAINTALMLGVVVGLTLAAYCTTAFAGAGDVALHGARRIHLPGRHRLFAGAYAGAGWAGHPQFFWPWAGFALELVGSGRTTLCGRGDVDAGGACLALATVPTRRQLWTWVGIAVFGMLVSLGVYGIVHGWLTVLIPMFDQFRAPARALILWALGVSVLAAVGVDRVMHAARGAWETQWTDSTHMTIFLRGGAILLGLVAVPLAYFALLITQADETTFLRASLVALALVYAAVFWVATWAIVAGQRAGWMQAAARVACCCWLSCMWTCRPRGAYTDISPSDPTQGFQHPAIVDFLRSDPDLFRIDTRTGIDDLWQPDTAALAGLQDVNGVANPLALQSRACLLGGNRRTRHATV